jgi:hypothetical protein
MQKIIIKYNIFKNFQKFEKKDILYKIYFYVII